MAPSTRGTKCGSCRRLPRGLGTPLVESLTGFVGRLGVWRLVHAESEGVRRDLSAQISAVNTRIDNVLLADRKRSSPSVTTSRWSDRCAAIHANGPACGLVFVPPYFFANC